MQNMGKIRLESSAFLVCQSKQMALQTVDATHTPLTASASIKCTKKQFYWSKNHSLHLPRAGSRGWEGVGCQVENPVHITAFVYF